jgi:hypothetical protein
MDVKRGILVPSRKLTKTDHMLPLNWLHDSSLRCAEIGREACSRLVCPGLYWAVGHVYNAFKTRLSSILKQPERDFR